MLTWTPDPSLSAYGCGFCGISCQVPVQATDPASGALLVDADWQPVMVNDEPAAAAEMGEHYDSWHPVLLDDGGEPRLGDDGAPLRAHDGEAPFGPEDATQG